MEPRAWVLRYQLTPEELAAAMVDHLPAIRARVRQTRRTLVLMVVLVAALSVAAGTGLVVALMPTLFLSILLVAGTGRSRMIKAHLKQVSATPSYTQPTELTIDGEGLRGRTAKSDCWHAWGYWGAVKDAPDGVALILHGGFGIQFIPARAFAPGQQAAWAAVVRDGVEAQSAPA